MLDEHLGAEVVLTVCRAVETTMEATRPGAAHDLSNPFDLRQISNAIGKVQELHPDKCWTE